MSEFSKFSENSGNRKPHNKKSPAKKTTQGNTSSKNKKPASSAPSSANRKKPSSSTTARRSSSATPHANRTVNGKRSQSSSKNRNINIGTSVISANTPQRAKKSGTHKKKKTKFQIFKKAVSVTASTLLSIFMIFVITFTICCTALTVWVLEFMDDTEDVTIESIALRTNTYFYVKDPNTGEFTTAYEINNSTPQIPIKIEDLPQHVCDAFVYLEDERFYAHDGVDYKRTFSAIANELLMQKLYGERQGGSTITQQLIKNITNDNAVKYDRKIREIFSAMQFEKKYTKSEILQGYMNYVEFGGGAKGIEVASKKYFGKSAKDLSIAEAATLAAIPKSPETLNPFADFEANQERKEYAIYKMYENGAISYDEYIAAMNEKIILTNSEEYKAMHPEENDEQQQETNIMPWYIDTAMMEVASWFQTQYGITQEEALSRINNDGYKIWTTVDLNMQNAVEAKYLDLSNFSSEPNSLGETPQSSFIAMDYSGNVLAVVGGKGSKDINLGLNRAVGTYRDPGSTIKPVTSYGKALQDNVITWSTKYVDKPLMKVDGVDWPNNYSNSYSYASIPIIEALKPSLNTIPAQLVDQVGLQGVFDFATKNMGLKLDDPDLDYSPLSIGSLTYGISLENLVNAYIPYGNGGTYYNAHIVSRVEKGDGTVLYSNESLQGTQAVDSDTAYIMNKMLQRVVNDGGTGTAAKLSNKVVAGKTGTSENWRDLSFIGLTEDFISGIWIGYDNTTERLPSDIKSAAMWKNIIGDYADSLNTGNQYPANNDVIEAYYCTDTGLIAGDNCPKSALPGYYKASNAPKCTSSHASASPTPDDNSQVDNQPQQNDAALPPADPNEQNQQQAAQ